MQVNKPNMVKAVLMVFALFWVSSSNVYAELSKDEAIDQALSKNGGGKVLNATQSNKNGKNTYKIKIISDGNVRVITITE